MYFYTVYKKMVTQQNMQILNDFGRRVRQLRNKLKISQEELASRAELHRTYIGMIERGEKNITIKNIQNIAKALEVDIHTLFIFDGDNNNA